MGKKIIIISHSLEVGGAERSLIGLLSSLNPKKVEIDGILPTFIDYAFNRISGNNFKLCVYV